MSLGSGPQNIERAVCLHGDTDGGDPHGTARFGGSGQGGTDPPS